MSVNLKTILFGSVLLPVTFSFVTVQPAHAGSACITALVASSIGKPNHNLTTSQTLDTGTDQILKDSHQCQLVSVTGTGHLLLRTGAIFGNILTSTAPNKGAVPASGIEVYNGGRVEGYMFTHLGLTSKLPDFSPYTPGVPGSGDGGGAPGYVNVNRGGFVSVIFAGPTANVTVGGPVGSDLDLPVARVGRAVIQGANLAFQNDSVLEMGTAIDINPDTGAIVPGANVDVLGVLEIRAGTVQILDGRIIGMDKGGTMPASFSAVRWMMSFPAFPP